MKTKLKLRNYVAKNATRSGAGRHIEKIGQRAPRVRQKRLWKREIRELL